MFKNFNGYNLIEAYHRMRHVQKYQPGRVVKKLIQALIVLILTLVLWNLPASVFGMEGLTVVQQRIIAILRLLR